MFLCSLIIDDLIHDYSEKKKANFFSELINNIHSSTYLSIFYLLNFGSIHSFFSPNTKSRFYLLLRAFYSLFTITYHFLLLSGEKNLQFSSVQFSRSVVSNSLWPHESQHTRPPCPSPSPGVHSNSRPLSRWCHPAISSSVVPFSSCPQFLPASESFPVSQLFAWGGQNTGVSSLASFLPKNTQGWSPLEWTGWISLQSKGLSRVFSNTTVQN